MSSKQNATIEPSANGGFAVIAANGELLQDGFKSRGHAAMWAARKGIYRSSAPPKRKTEIPIPDALADERIFPIGFASLHNRNYVSFLPEAKAGKWGTLRRLQRGRP
jgi:hypothetical protein